MLPRSKRLSVPLFANVLAKGSIVHSPFFTARIFKTTDPEDSGTRFSVVISKKIAKTAVERNTLRRRSYSALRTIDEQLKNGYHVVLVAKMPLSKANIPAITRDLEILFVKSDLIK